MTGVDCGSCLGIIETEVLVLPSVVDAVGGVDPEVVGLDIFDGEGEVSREAGELALKGSWGIGEDHGGGGQAAGGDGGDRAAADAPSDVGRGDGEEGRVVEELPSGELGGGAFVDREGGGVEDEADDFKERKSPARFGGEVGGIAGAADGFAVEVVAEVGGLGLAPEGGWGSDRGIVEAGGLGAEGGSHGPAEEEGESESEKHRT